MVKPRSISAQEIRVTPTGKAKIQVETGERYREARRLTD